MRQKRKETLKTFFLKSNSTLKRAADNHKVGFWLYNYLFLPTVVGGFRLADYKIGKMISSAYKRDLDKQLKHYMPDVLDNPKKRKRIEKDIVKSYFTDGMFPSEYMLYNFQDQGYYERHEWLSDMDSNAMLLSLSSEEAFNDTRNKARFYAIMKDYFHRQVCVISSETSMEEFVHFALLHEKFIVKPMEGTTGNGTFIATVNNVSEAEELYIHLLSEGEWIAEELIRQHPDMAKWNPSSVNTLRIPTFRTNDGCRILQPFFRTGRKGAVVDNAGQGGVFAVFNPDTGIITTDGVDEYGGRYEQHPDSHLTFKGWQIPQYEQLKKIAAELIHRMPMKQRYVGFDFALTQEGWVLVEGNSLGQFVGQIAEQKGVRKQFMEYLKDEA